MCQLIAHIKAQKVWTQYETNTYDTTRMRGGIKEPDVQALFLVDLCKTLANLWDFGHHVVLGMDTNDDVRDGVVSEALAEIVLKKV